MQRFFDAATGVKGVKPKALRLALSDVMCALRYHSSVVHTIQIKTASAAYSVYIGSNILANLGSRLPKLNGASSVSLARVFVLTSPSIWS
jgi:hypothetical protein